MSNENEIDYKPNYCECGEILFYSDEEIFGHISCAKCAGIENKELSIGGKVFLRHNLEGTNRLAIKIHTIQAIVNDGSELKYSLTNLIYNTDSGDISFNSTTAYIRHDLCTIEESKEVARLYHQQLQTDKLDSIQNVILLDEKQDNK